MSSRSAALRVGHSASRVQQVTAKSLRILHSNRGIVVVAGDGGQVTGLTVEKVDSQTHIFGGDW